MVIECVQLQIKPGEEAAFEHAMIQGRRHLLSAVGCHSVLLARGVEQPSSYLLQLEWDAIEAHTAFTATEDFSAFRTLAGPFFAERPNMAHFSPVS